MSAVRPPKDAQHLLAATLVEVASRLARDDRLASFTSARTIV